MGKKRGFTLVELLVVISIIGLLSSVVLSVLTTTRAKARDTQRIQALGEMRKALLLYYDTNGKYPGGSGAITNTSTSYNSGVLGNWNLLQTAIGNNFIAVLPVDPKNTTTGVNATIGYNNIFWQSSLSYGYGYRVKNDGSDYDLITKFETQHPLRCGLKQYISHRKFGFGPQDEWCELESGGPDLSDMNAVFELYAIAP